jgi:sugar/nucleoside kinase (ribokinase family)
MSESSHETERDVVGLGNAIVDVLAHTDDSFLSKHDLTKGAMTLVDADQAARLYALVSGTVECSGGSAANTMVGLVSLGSRAGYIGKVRDDDLGAIFTRDIRAAGVAFDTEPARSGPATAQSLVLVSPDAQRTMLTFLGASAALSPADVDPAVIRSAKVTYLEGYLWDPPPAKEAFLKAAELAHSSDRLVALSLSDAFCVERHRKEFLDLVEHHVDILFANEDELVSLYEASGFDAAVAQLKGCCRWAALTRGAAGAVVLHGDDSVEVPAEPVADVLDTTGAGDLFAAGFLHGLTRGVDAATCARLGAIAAAEAISHFGARPEKDLEQLTAALL